VNQSHSSISRIEHGFETLVFASRRIQAPLYGGLIVAELLYVYKFLVELWEMVRHINQQEETTFMLGVLGLIDPNGWRTSIPAPSRLNSQPH